MADETSSGEIQSLMAGVFALVEACPVGKVTTYGWIARALGYPRGARMVGWIMNKTPRGVPAQRVLNSKGELSGGWAFGGHDVMRQLLEAEGITFSADERVDLKWYGWDPARDLSEEERQRILGTATSPIQPDEQLLHLMRDDPASPFRSSPSDQ